MIACPHCQHENAAAGNCAGCGKALGAPSVGPTASASAPASRPGPGELVAMGWDSVGYFFDYLRGRVDARARARRVGAEKLDNERMLAGAVAALGAAVRASGVRMPALEPTLDALAEAESRRSAAAQAVVEQESLNAAEDARRAADEAARQAEWQTSEAAAVDAEGRVRATSEERRGVADSLARVSSSTETATDAGSSAGAVPSGGAGGTPTAAAPAGDRKKTLEDEAARLDAELVALRAKAQTLRAVADDAKAKRDAGSRARRQAAGAAATAAAERTHQRVVAERRTEQITEELGRLARHHRITSVEFGDSPTAAALIPAYQRIDRLQQSVAARAGELDALADAGRRYDRRKLFTGAGVVCAGALLLMALLGVIF